MNEARRIVLRLGISRLGPVDPQVPEYLNSISNIEELERLVEVVAKAQSWDELLPGS